MAFPVQRKGGVVIARRRRYWQVMNHKTLEPKLAKVDLITAGIYGWIRIMAGNGHWDGSLWYGEQERLKVKDLTAFIARRLGGDNHDKYTEHAKDIMTKLRDAELVIWGVDRVVYAVDFASEQFKPQTAGAERQRSFRARQSGSNVAEESDQPGESPQGGGSGQVTFAPADNVPGCASTGSPPPPPPASTPTPTDSTATQHRPGYGFIPESNRSEQSVTRDARIFEDRKRDYRPFEFDPTRPAGGGGGGVRAGATTAVDVYSMDPVKAACLLTGENHPWAVNGFRAALGRVGEPTFRAALGQLRAALESGVQPRPRRDGTPGTRGAMLQGYIRANEEGRAM